MTPSDAPASTARATRLGGLLLLGVGLLAALEPLSARWPHDQRIVFALSPEVCRGTHELDATFTREGSAEAFGGFSATIEGDAPATVPHEFSAPNGAFVLDVTLSGGARGAAGGTARTFTRRVSFNGSTVVVPLGEIRP